MDQISHYEHDIFFLHLSGACPNLIDSCLFFLILTFVWAVYLLGPYQDLKWLQPVSNIAFLSSMENTCIYTYV